MERFLLTTENSNIIEKISNSTLNINGNVSYNISNGSINNNAILSDGTNGNYISSFDSEYLEFQKYLQIDFYLTAFEIKNQFLVFKDSVFKIENLVTGEIQASIYDFSNSSYISVTSKTKIEKYDRNKISFQYNGYSIFLYINGVLESKLAYNKYLNSNGSDLIIFNDSSFSNSAYCQIEELLIKTNLDTPAKIFNNSIIEENILPSASIKINQSLTAGYRLKLKQEDPLNSWIEGLKEFLYINQLFNNQKSFYFGMLWDVYSSPFGVNNSADIISTNATWNNGAYKNNIFGGISVLSNNLIPYILPINSNQDTYTWNLNYCLLVIDSNNDNTINTSYSIDDGNSWNFIAINKYSQIFQVTKNFKLKFDISNSTTELKGFAIQFF